MRTQEEKETIENEQRKLANRLKEMSPEERSKQTYGLMCWLQGYEAGRLAKGDAE